MFPARFAVALVVVLAPFMAGSAAARMPADDCVDVMPPKVDPEPCALDPVNMCFVGDRASATQVCAAASVQGADVDVCVDWKCAEVHVQATIERRLLPVPLPTLDAPT